MTNLIQSIVVAVIVAILGVVGNIIYLKRKTSKDLLRQRLTNLLLPLYVILHLEEVTTEAWAQSGEGDYAEIHSALPTRTLSPIEKIIKENIYLADDSLHEACIDFLQWAYRSDTNQRYQDLMNGDFNSATQDSDFKKFYDIVIFEYNNARHQYLKK